jgi:hypothetical protein
MKKLGARSLAELGEPERRSWKLPEMPKKPKSKRRAS